MSSPRILSVGNCSADHGALQSVLQRRWGAETLAAADTVGAFAALRSGRFDLVLVNRIFDADGSEGIDLIRAIKNDPQLSAVPVMMITNFPDHQQLAVAAGALPGFGKRDLGSPEMLDTVGTVLNGTLNKTS